MTNNDQDLYDPEDFDDTDLVEEDSPPEAPPPAPPEQSKSALATIKTTLQSQRFIQKVYASTPAHVNADRVVRTALMTIAESPMLQQCTPASLARSVMTAAQHGLEFSKTLGQASLVPFKNNRAGTWEAQLVVGYRGRISLARRTGEVASVTAHIVYDNDEFELEYGLNPKLVHRPTTKPKGKPKGAYAVARWKDASWAPQFEWMTSEQIEQIRDDSPNGKAANSPWATNPGEMWRKTVINRLCKFLPMAAEERRQGDAGPSTLGRILPDGTVDMDVHNGRRVISVDPDDTTTG